MPAEKLLIISPNAEDYAALRGLVDDRHWQVWSAPTCWDALEPLISERIAVIFCDELLEDGTWKDILNYVGTGAAAPLMVVTSRVGDARLWSEVLNLGGYDVLLKPFDPRDVSHVLRTIALRTAPHNMRAGVAGAA